MHNRSRFPSGLYVVAACLLLPCALAQKVNIDYDHDADFSHIRQYQWRTHPVFEKKPQLQQVYATGIQLVMGAGNEQLMKQGLTPVDFSPDIFVTFFLHAAGGEEIRIVDAGYGWYGLPAWTTTEIDPFVDGTLVIDIVDAGSSKLVWRAMCNAKIKDFNNRHKQINSAVKKALQQFPPKAK